MSCLFAAGFSASGTIRPAARQRLAGAYGWAGHNETLLSERRTRPVGKDKHPPGSCYEEKALDDGSQHDLPQGGSDHLLARITLGVGMSRDVTHCQSLSAQEPVQHDHAGATPLGWVTPRHHPFTFITSEG